MIDNFLRDASGVLSCPFWSTVLQCGARLPIHNFGSHLTGGLSECEIDHRRSVAVICMLYKIRCNQMHPLNDALPGPYVLARVTRGAIVAHRYTYAPPRCRTSQYRRTFILISVSLWNDPADPMFDGVGLAGFRSTANGFLLSQAALSLLLSSTIFPFHFFLSIGWYCGAEVFGLIGCISLSLSLALPTSFNSNNNNNNNIPLIHSVYHISFTSSISRHFRPRYLKQSLTLMVRRLVSHAFDPHVHTSSTSYVYSYLHSISAFLFRILYQTHSPVCITSPLSQPLVLYHLQITAGLNIELLNWFDR